MATTPIIRVEQFTDFNKPNATYEWDNDVIFEKDYVFNHATYSYERGAGRQVGYKDAQGKIVFSELPNAQAIGSLGIGSESFYVGGQPHRIVNGSVSAVDQYGKPLGQGLADEYQTAFDEAKAVNEQRYEDIDKGYSERLDTAMNELEGLGLHESAQINQRYDELFAEGQQDAVSRGLSGSTLMPTLRAGVDQQRSQDLGALEERLSASKSQTYSDLFGQQLQFQERREDMYPDFNLLAKLSQMQGAAGGTMAMPTF